MVKSPRLSFKGYKFSEAIYRNKDSVKVILSLLATINGVTRDWNVFFITVGISVATLIVKLAVDAFDYFVTEVEN